ncbi:unnamed protein product, partial [Musa hybrid cultivar]
ILCQSSWEAKAVYLRFSDGLFLVLACCNQVHLVQAFIPCLVLFLSICCHLRKLWSRSLLHMMWKCKDLHQRTKVLLHMRMELSAAQQELQRLQTDMGTIRVIKSIN